MPCKVLLIDSDRDWQDRVKGALRPFLLTVQTANARDGALRLVARTTFSLVVLDADTVSVDAYSAALRTRRRPELIVTTSKRDYAEVLAALRAGASEVLCRPVSPADIAKLVSGLLDRVVASPHYLGRRIDRYIQNNCGRTGLSLKEIGGEFGISSSYASVLLRQGAWRGFRDRLARHRVEKAKALLRSGDDPLYSISEECGFRSPSRLSETFARLEGVTPKRYREGAEPRQVHWPRIVTSGCSAGSDG